jgi:hypothetical protein
MSNEFDGFLAPAFRPEDALVQLKRSLRDLKLAERGAGFELRGKCVAELRVDDATLQAHIARKLALTPEWDKQVLRSTGDTRKWLDELKKRLARWATED